VKQSTNDTILVIGLAAGLGLILFGAFAGAGLVGLKIFPANASRVIQPSDGQSVDHLLELQGIFGTHAAVVPQADGTYGVFVGPQDFKTNKLPSWAVLL